MGDIDERMMGRAASQSRFLPNDQQVISDPLSKQIFEYEQSHTPNDRELLEIIQKIERSNPERCSKAPKFVSQLLTHRTTPIRKFAFAACLKILAHPQSPRQMMLDSYHLALVNSNPQVAQHALSLLPKFVDACPEEANNLIKFGSIAYNRLPAPCTDVESFLSKSYTKASQ
ncbi:Integrator complex subunit 1 R4 domain-containing protein [Caenorhabditis elegans]|uniref:Integrator complex subunit 1 R4 domain-containing protein n=1 Tax=Caenorhabditis elegans TaxID=6239 RepID=Q95QH1_CAEEL|nr:CCR4-NOT transcription complex subunit 11 [Caenorhabditis elegans]CAC70089.1 CCR4-NOT transcription complex subunit 11 [Caenorhabditis elegans]|eukprot:NP_492415.1 Uncharacterized protein CELE_F32H2.10 [Caenorhabditis elegans]